MKRHLFLSEYQSSRHKVTSGCRVVESDNYLNGGINFLKKKTFFWTSPTIRPQNQIGLWANCWPGEQEQIPKVPDAKEFCLCTHVISPSFHFALILECLITPWQNLGLPTPPLKSVYTVRHTVALSRKLSNYYTDNLIYILFERVLHLKPVHSWSVPGQAGHRVGCYRNPGVYGRCFAVHIAHSKAHLSYFLPALSTATPSPVYAALNNKGDKNITMALNSDFLIIK